MKKTVVFELHRNDADRYEKLGHAAMLMTCLHDTEIATHIFDTSHDPTPEQMRQFYICVEWECADEMALMIANSLLANRGIRYKVEER